MKFGSICSGIEAASVAFGPLGWTAEWFSEIEKFPCAVLKHHYPEVPNLGDITKVDWTQYRGKADLVCAGPPCQAFSIAGLRKSLEDDRGNLSLTAVRTILAIRPRWLFIENVPGMLNTDDNAFGCLLAGLSGANEPLMPGTADGRWRSAGIVSGPGYGLAWRVLNAEFFGVPQSRRRIFLVGYLGNWIYPAAVLFERESLQGNFKTGKKKGEEIAATITGGSTTKSNQGKRSGSDRDNLVVMATGQANAEITEGRVPALNCNHEAPIVAFTQNQCGDVLTGVNLPAMGCNSNATGRNTAKIQQGASVRRLTPGECEAAQGFPSGYTKIPYRGKPADKCPDGPRYKAIGNSWAVPCARWIGERIMMVDSLRGNNDTA